MRGRDQGVRLQALFWADLTRTVHGAQCRGSLCHILRRLSLPQVCLVLVVVLIFTGGETEAQGDRKTRPGGQDQHVQWAWWPPGAHSGPCRVSSPPPHPDPRVPMGPRGREARLPGSRDVTGRSWPGTRVCAQGPFLRSRPWRDRADELGLGAPGAPPAGRLSARAPWHLDLRGSVCKPARTPTGGLA